MGGELLAGEDAETSSLRQQGRQTFYLLHVAFGCAEQRLQPHPQRVGGALGLPLLT